MSSHRLFIAILVVVFQPICLFAESVDLSKIYQCDPLFCPDNQGIPTPLGEEVNHRVGIGVGSANEGIQQVDRVVVSLEEETSASTPSPKYTNPQINPSEYSNESGHVDNGEMKSSQSDPEESITTEEVSQSSVGVYSGGAVTSNPNQVAVSNNGNGTLTAGGLLYSDENDIDSRVSERSFDTGTSISEEKDLSFDSNNAIQANLSQDTANRKAKANSPQRFLASTAPGGTLQSNESPSSGRSQEKKGLIEGSLEGLVSALGKFGNAIGIGSSSGSKPPFSGSEMSTKKTSNTDKRQALLVDKTLLQKKLNAHLRGLASDLKLGSSESNIFQNMCQHYDHYTLQNRIPSDVQGCEGF